jgi:hypothetical protein
VLGKQIKTVSILNSVPYDKVEAVRTLERELEWRNYGGKHHESIYTRFFQSYILPTKFGIDKRKAHLSSLIMSGQLSRDEALQQLSLPIADPEQVASDLRYVAKKFGISDAAFAGLMQLPVKSYRDYPNESNRYEYLKRGLRLVQRYGLLPKQVGM